MEEQLWKADWNRRGSIYTVSLVEHPGVRARGRSLEEAIDLLEDRIADALGDAVPHLVWIRPLPAPKESTPPSPFLHLLAGHNGIEDITNMQALFDQPNCEDCENTSGHRTTTLIQLRKAPKDDLCFTPYLGQIISARLAEFLKLGEQPDIELLPVHIATPTSAVFWEMRSSHPRPYVARRGVTASQAWRCPDCGTTVMAYMPHEAPYFQYVEETCLPDAARDVFPIGVEHELRLAVGEATRSAVLQSKQFKNVATRKVGILPKHEAQSVEAYFNCPMKKTKRSRGR